MAPELVGIELLPRKTSNMIELKNIDGGWQGEYCKEQVHTSMLQMPNRIEMI